MNEHRLDLSFNADQRSVFEDVEYVPNSPNVQESAPSADETRPSKFDSKYFMILPTFDFSCEIPNGKLPITSSERFESDTYKAYVTNEVDNFDQEKRRKNYDNEVMSRIAEVKEQHITRSLVCIYPYFFDDLFWRLIGAGCRVISPNLVLNSLDVHTDIQRMKRHLYNIAMRDLVICFTGFRDKDEVMKMGRMVTAMGGSLREKMSCKITHLVAPQASGIKYRCALTSKIPVVSRDWIYVAWSHKDDSIYHRPGAASKLGKDYSILPFHGCKLSFIGFSESSLAELIHQTEINGGKIVDCNMEKPEEIATHIVMHERHARATTLSYYPTCEIVRVEWFWACLQKRYLEKPDAYRLNADAYPLSPHNSSRQGVGCISDNGNENRDTPRSRRSGITTKMQRRSRQAEFNERVIHLAQLSSDSLGSPMNSIIGRDSISYTSILDATGDSMGTENDNNETSLKSPLQDLKISKTPDSGKKRKYTPRYGKVMELIHTESNYVGILECMVSIIRKEILDPNQPGGSILSERDAEVVFRDIDPLLDVHTSLQESLAGIGKEEIWINDASGENVEVGSIMLQHLDAIKRVYPPFVNFYDQRKDAVEDLAKKYSRFHAYLRRCQSRKETGRNSIIDLMIRPVQRLPSMMLILQDLLKHTGESFRDHELLSSAIKELKLVLSSINEDKRRTEGFLAVFNVIHAIDGCPPDLASSHRQFLGQVDVAEVTDRLADFGQGLTMFLFSDQLEICRRKRNGTISRSGSIRSTTNPNAADDISIISGSTVSIPAAVAASQSSHPTLPSTPGPSMSNTNTSSVGHPNGKKKYKHVILLPLADIECTTDLRKHLSVEDEFRAFALVLKKKSQETSNDVYAFAVIDDTDKITFLRMIAQQILITTCKNGTADCLINEMTPGAFNIDIEEAFKRHTITGKAKRLRQKVSKALSFSRTPRKMKRAVSHLPSYGMGNLVDIGSPSTMDLRDSSASMDMTFTPMLNRSNVSRSVATLTPTSRELTPRHRLSTCTLNMNGETFLETDDIDPDALFPSSPTIPDMPINSHSNGRPSIAVLLKQRLTNVCRRSLSSNGSRHSLVASMDETITERKKRPRLTTIFSQSSFNRRSRSKAGGKLSLVQAQNPMKVGYTSLSEKDFNTLEEDLSPQPIPSSHRLRNRAGSLVPDTCLLPKLCAVQEFRRSCEGDENKSPISPSSPVKNNPPIETTTLDDCD